jgi:hypothetical protein
MDMADNLLEQVASMARSRFTSDVMVKALEDVWMYGNLDKRTSLENVALDGTVLKYDNRLTQQVHDALQLVRNARQL